MDLSDSFNKDQIIMVVSSKGNYRQDMNSLQDQISNNFEKIGYITINKPYNDILEDLKKNSIDVSKFRFADAITSTVKAQESTDDCIFVSSPTALTDLGLAFSMLLSDKNCDCALFDTISTLLVYLDKGTVTKFVHNMTTKARVLRKKAVFIALREDSESLIKDLNMFVDNVIEL